VVVFNSHLQLREALHGADTRQNRDKDLTIGFVATMGALHQGHLELIKQAKQQNDIVVVSIFVNPTQFLKGEDFDKYPKREEADQKICKVAGVDYLFCPSSDELYSHDEVSVHAPHVRGYILEGASRPGHFNGVLTVVMKLLNIVQPTNAYFGKKDAQQLYLISLMARQMFLNVNIVPVQTMRDDDGLALSSRNSYLTAEQRAQALKIPASLRRATNMVIAKRLDANEIIDEMKVILEPLQIAYIAIVDREFQVLEQVEINNSIILVEVLVGGVRLLDNIWL
jgi:pantoate--beta-alanine ligase